MLSTAAFNALLKTLEEPPPHVKFVFATTESARSRSPSCRAASASTCAASRPACWSTISPASAPRRRSRPTPDALALIARAAEGSVRDALSLLDQAFCACGRAGRAEDLRAMMGLADRGRIIELFDALMRGDAAGALKELRDQYDSGADPAVAMIDLADFTHFVTRVKIVPTVADDPAFSEIERTRGARLRQRALDARPLAHLADAVQGHRRRAERAEAAGCRRDGAGAHRLCGRPAGARGCHPFAQRWRRCNSGAGTVRKWRRRGIGSAGPAPGLASARQRGADALSVADDPHPARSWQQQQLEDTAESAVPLVVGKFEDLIALAAEKRDLQMKISLERDVRLVRFEDGQLEIALEAGASKALVHDLARKLSIWTGRRWMVVVSAEAGAPTMKAQADTRQQELQTGVAADPLVQAVLNRFPGSQIVGVRARGAPEEPPPVLDVPPVNDEAAFDTELRPDDGDDD